MRKFVLGLIFLCIFSSVSFGFTGEIGQFSDQLDSITDVKLRKTLENSIVAGLISNAEELNSAIDLAEKAANNQSAVFYSARGSDFSAIRKEISEKTAPLAALDKDAIVVKKVSGFKATRLFHDIEGDIPESYKLAYDLCEKFNPKSGTNDAKRLDKEIDKFLSQIANDPVMKSALESTGTTMADLKKNWFGSGLGFEHVIAGEVKGSKVSGYHWWYKFYCDERDNRAQVISSCSDIGNEHVYTGSFRWDPDGKNGPLPNAKKPKGGFLLNSSVQSLLALGHIAMETAKKYGNVPGAMTFRADLNGEEFNWQLYTMGGTIRSLYPMGIKKGDFNTGGDDNFYSLEEELAGSK